MSLEDIEGLSDKHKKIRDNYKEVKSSHLEKLGSKMLRNDEKFKKLKDKKINNNFLKHF
jgi:hypothetical protein